MKRDRWLPELEIELQPLQPALRAPEGGEGPQPQPVGHRTRRQLVIAVAAVVAAGALIATMVLDDSDPERVTPTTAPTSVPATRILLPGILGRASTGLLLWSIDTQSRLQVLDLDSGELRVLGNRSGLAMFGLSREIVLFDGDSGSRVVNASGQTITAELGRGVMPVAVRDSQTLWVLAEERPRRWQKRSTDGTLLDELPFDGSVWLTPHGTNAVLLSSLNGTSLFDLDTRQQKPITPTRVIAAGGYNLIGQTCSGERCTLTVIDADFRVERVLLADISAADANTALLSPDGRYLAIAPQASGADRRAEIIDVATAKTVWQRPASMFFSGSGPAWSWSPDSTWLFVKVAAERMLAIDMRSHPFSQYEIGLPLAAGQDIAVTRR